MGRKKEIEEEGTETGRKGGDGGGKWNMRMEQENGILGQSRIRRP
jgi:hypothetical protein